MLIALLLAATLPQGQALTDAVAAADNEFFGLFFTGCDPVALERQITPDFEMYHDKGGVVAKSGAAFVAQYAKDCEAKKAPDAWRSRRELVPGTLKVWPVGNWGAFEQGEHVFYERRGDGPEKKVGRAAFTQVWTFDNGQWRLSRVLSYDHSALP